MKFGESVGDLYLSAYCPSFKASTLDPIVKDITKAGFNVTYSACFR